VASQVVKLYTAIADLALRPAQERLRINYIDLEDANRTGVEFGDRVKRLGPQRALNAVIVSPMTPEEQPADAARRNVLVVQPFNVCYIYKREPTTELKDIVEQWADPLHDVLNAEQMRRLGNLTLTDAAGNRIGHVDGFVAFLPDFDSANNAMLYEVGLACFDIRVEVSYRIAKDYETLPRTVRR